MPVLVALRLETAAEKGWQRSWETSDAEEEKERREQMDRIGRGSGFGAILWWVRPIWSDVMDAPGRIQASPYPPHIWARYEGPRSARAFEARLRRPSRSLFYW